MSQQAFWLFLKMDKRNLFVQMALQDTGRDCVFCCAIPDCVPESCTVAEIRLPCYCTAEKNWSNG